MDCDRYVLDENGEAKPEPDLFKWAAWFENSANRIIAHDYLPNGVSVSTVFLGIDHNFFHDGGPVLWETMIFGGTEDSYQERYRSREYALEGHQIALAIAQAAMGATT
jgi:hypothetical protein